MSNPTGESSGTSRVFGGVYNETSIDEPSIEHVQAHEGSAITTLSEPLNEENWMGWQEQMRRKSFVYAEYWLMLTNKFQFLVTPKVQETGNSMTTMLK